VQAVLAQGTVDGLFGEGVTYQEMQRLCRR
jgi:hypothetical protein